MAGLDNTGVIFDIQRGSMHDGPGVRTTVFFKGCSLHCIWCHNPESREFIPQLFFNPEKCTACGDCVNVCEQDVHHLRDGLHVIDYDKCIVCGSCVEACNQQALKILGRRMSVEDVMQEVLPDRSYYEHSGGGLTLSGGEPMAQFSFALDLLKAAKLRGIHTCLETSGFFGQKGYEEILPYVDLFLIDYKITDSTDHQRYTGVPNQQILSNLDYLYRQHKSVILRCPIIPGVNDSIIHFQAIHDLDVKYPDLLGIEILPYHDMGNSKRTGIGIPITLVGLKTASQDMASEWLEQIHELGCEKARIG